MSSRGRLSLDLNEPPAEEEDEKGNFVLILPQKSLPTSSLDTSFLFQSKDGVPRIVNNHAFTHASSGCGFQPFVRSKNLQTSKEGSKQKGDDLNVNEASISLTASRCEDSKVLHVGSSGAQDFQAVDREEGELCDMDGNDETLPSDGRDKHDVANVVVEEKPKIAEENEHGFVRTKDNNDSSFIGSSKGELGGTDKEGKLEAVLGSEGSGDLNSTSKGGSPADGLEEPPAVLKPKDIKGVEASHAPMIANNPGKRPKIDEHKEAMLGKKRARQTVFINAEDVKHAGSMKTSTPKKPASFPSIVTRTVKETSRASSATNERSSERQSQSMTKTQKQTTMSFEGSNSVEFTDQKAEPNGDVNLGSRSRSRKTNGNESPNEVYPPITAKEDSWKQSSESRQFKKPPALSRKPTVTGQSVADPKVGNKKHLPPKKQTSNNLQYQDTSVERLHREVTSDKFWHHPEEAELRCVPGHFESAEEYVRVFEPLLFEECRAQLYNTWEELTESSRDAYTMVRVRTVERRERGSSRELMVRHAYKDYIPDHLNVCMEIFNTVMKGIFNTLYLGCVLQQYTELEMKMLCNYNTASNWFHKISKSISGQVLALKCCSLLQEFILCFCSCNGYLSSRHRGWRECLNSIIQISRWYDVIVFPAYECKWTFKEGDVAILSSPRPGAARYSRRITNAGANKEDSDPDISGRVAGTVRRHIPIDTREPIGAILHFYVGDSYDSSRVEDNHVRRKFQPKSVCYLTVLGSLATTQREYIALHAFRRLSLQMQNAILKPSPEHFPKYEEQPPAMPECFTPSFIDHLHRTFNGPQLGAIQWAAMHTAAGTSSGVAKRQEPWPFTLVQGPPGTGKTHTVWGMLNVIHLVQYQHYYTALLKQLAPESYKQSSECSSESVSMGSIDEVLQSMDQNLFRTLPKLSPKPRMLVCAPSNAATDELLARVLDRGFIDGEMSVYRPDVARVGVDSQTRAAQAVSVERRTEQLLLKGRDEVIGWMHQLRAREAQFSQQIALLQRQLNAAAVVGRSQGSVGVDPDVLVARDQNRDVLLRNLAQAVEQRDKVLVEMTRLCILESRFRAGSNFNLEDARAHLEASFANEAEIVFTTVSSSGRKIFSRLTHGFDMVVIDEAAQASEVAVLPPLSLGAARCVLVGDPQQLPATVISKAAGTLLYSRSLFERFQQAGCPTMLLSVQYRMHPLIRDFPSRYFYQGRLTDSESVANLPVELYHKDPLLQPYMFYDIMHGRESHRGGSVSYQNIHEAQFSRRLYEYLHNFVKSNGGKKITVGIITPYKLQLKCLQREFEEILNSEEGKDLYINTVDAFQGQERDVIIMSCVRASNHGVGFVADIRRMNVALTRARRALWVVGNANALMQSDDWAALITDAKSRNCFKDMDSISKKLLIWKGSTHSPEKFSSSDIRSLGTSGQRRTLFDMHLETKSGTPSEDEDWSNNIIRRNGSYRDIKPPDNSLDDLGHSNDRSRDAMR